MAEVHVQECDNTMYDLAGDIMCFKEGDREGMHAGIIPGTPFDKDPDAFKEAACCKESGVVQAGDTCPVPEQEAGSEAGATKTFLQIVQEKERAVKQLADHVQRSSSGMKKCQALSTCLDEVPCHLDTCGKDLAVGADAPVCSTSNVKRPGACSGSDCEGRTANFLRSSIARSTYRKDMDLTLGEKEMVCSTTGLDAVFQETHDDDTVWSYFGSYNGVWRAYPGDARTRDEQGCREYDPRVRPWYLSAASGSKNLVIVIDVSGSMNAYDGSNFDSRMDLVRDAVTGLNSRGLLDTITQNDRVSVVTFSNEAQGLNSGLVAGTAENIGDLKAKVNNIKASGRTYTLSGLTVAFDQLIEATESEVVGDSCNNIMLFLTDGVDTVCEKCHKKGPPAPPQEYLSHGGVSTPEGRCRCQEAVLEAVDRKQKQLEGVGGRRAEIFSLSMGSDADDSLPRQLACRNNGAWDRISAGDAVLDKLEAYLKFQSMDKAATDAVFWSEPYADDILGDQVVTAAVPVYEDNQWRNLLGVVGVDVMFEPLKESTDDTAERVLQRLQSRSRVCTGSFASGCDLQMLRDENSACPAVAPSMRAEPNTCCMKGSNDGPSHIRVGAPMTYDEASAFCSETYGDGASQVGRLAGWTTRSVEDLSELAGFAPPDGAWIGVLKRGSRPNDRYVWNNGDNFDVGISVKVSTGSYASALEEGASDQPGGCGFISPTGMVGNINFDKCVEKKAFICFLPEGAVDSACGPDAQCLMEDEEKEDKNVLGEIIGLIVGALTGGGIFFAVVRAVLSRRRNAKQNKSNVSVVCCSSNVTNDSHDTQVDHDERGKKEVNTGAPHREVEMSRQPAPVQVTVNVAAPAAPHAPPAAASDGPSAYPTPTFAATSFGDAAPTAPPATGYGTPDGYGAPRSYVDPAPTRSYVDPAPSYTDPPQ